MSIKYLNPKTYGAIFQKLVNGYRKVKGKEPTGLDLIKIKLEAADQVKQSEKIIKFPEEKITPFYEERPSKGPQADIKSFPKKQTNQPTSLESINKLVKDLQDIYEKSPTLTEIMGVSNKYPKKEGIVKITTDYLKTKDEKGIMDEVKKIIDKKGSYADLSEEERRRILGEAQDLLDNPKKTAEEIIDEGDFDPSGMMNGGRIGYSVGAGKKGVQGLLNLVKNKFGKKSITTADKVARPEKAVVKDLFDEFNKRLKEKDLQKTKKMKRQLTDEEIEDYEEILGDSETWMNKGTVEEAEAAVKRQKEYEQQMYAEYKVEKQGRKELEEAYKEIDFRMTGEDTKYEANELADMLAEIRYKTEMSDLPQKTQIDLYGEAYDYLMEVKRDAANFKGATNIKTGKNIVTGEQEIPIDPMTGKPRKLNAKGGRIGFSAGGIDKARRAFLKILGGGAATGVAVKTGLGGLLKSGEKAKDVAKVVKAAETVKNAPPSYVFDLANIIRAKGKDITKQAGTIERETVKTYKGVELYETPDGFRIKTDTLGPYENSKEVELVVTKKTDVVDEGTKSQKKVESIDYEEATVTPDQEGKMKDLNFYVDDKDHAELKKLVDEEEGFKSGGLAYLLGE